MHFTSGLVSYSVSNRENLSWSLDSLNQSSAKQERRKIKDSLWEKGSTAAAYRAKEVQKCYLDTMDEPIHEECVLGKRLV